MKAIDIGNPARDVLNQPPPLQPTNLFEIDLPLREALEREGGAWGVGRATRASPKSGAVPRAGPRVPAS